MEQPPTGDERAVESDDVDGFYGGKDLASAIRDVYLYDDYDALRDFRSKDMDRVWSGWDAALIVSKREKAHCAFTQYTYGEREDVARVIKPEECEIHLGKRKAGETLEAEGRDVTNRKVSQLLQPYQKKEEDNHLIVLNFGKDKPKKEYSFDRELEVHELSAIEGECKTELHIAKAVAALTLRLMVCSELWRLEELLPNEEFKKFRGILFDSFAKFVLSVFDTEDFERIYNHNVVKDECSTFFSNLYTCDCDPLTVVADGRVELDKFSTLREHDLCDILQRYQDFAEDEDLEVRPRFFPISPVQWDDISESDITSAMMVMRKYVPLKDDCKMQLTLELTRAKSYRVHDTLVLEALKDIDIEDLFSHFPDASRYELSHSAEEMVMEQAEIADHELSHRAGYIIIALFSLICDKHDELVYFQKAVAFPLSSGKFGPCTEEVIEVIQIADHERRMQGERFIGLRHISFGLSLSRVGDCFKSFLHDGELKCLGGLPSKFSMFGIYKLSRDAADYLGNEAVGLEHLVLAIVFGKQEGYPVRRETLKERISLSFDDNAWKAEVLERLRNSDTKCGVESWEETDVYSEFLPENCRDGPVVTCGGFLLIKELRRALESGRLKLAAIRKENVQHSSS